MGETDLVGLERLLAAATPGPWWVWDRGVGYHLAVEDPDGNTARGYGSPQLLPEGGRTDLGRREDADLIVALINAAPALVAAVRERDAVIAAVRELAEQWDQVDYGVGRYHEDSAFRDGRELEAGKCADDLRTALAVLPGIEQEGTK